MIAIGIGSNLGNSIETLVATIKDFDSHQKILLKSISSLYISKPVDGSKQNNFYNAVIEIDTALSPIELLAECQKLEQKYDRKYYYRWGPRTLDLDILCFHDEINQTEQLKLPHPELQNRDFVLTPLLEIAPDIKLINLGHLKHLPTPPKNIIEQRPLDYKEYVSA